MGIELGHWDPYGYFPGLPASSAKLNPMPEGSKNFEICNKTNDYIESKKSCMRLNRNWYYQKIPGLFDIKKVVGLLANMLHDQNPKLFNLTENSSGYELFCGPTNETITFSKNWDLVTPILRYQDSFDAICMQIPEDIIVQKIVEGEDKTVAAHLCHANGWSARWAIGKSFGEIHDGVRKSNGSHVIKTPGKMVKHLVNMKKPIERVGAINFKTDSLLDRHPSHPKERYRPFNIENPKLYMRFERQTVIPVPEMNSFVFTIKTYFVDCKEEPELVLNAIENSDKDVYSRHFLSEHRNSILNWLYTYTNKKDI